MPLALDIGEFCFIFHMNMSSSETAIQVAPDVSIGYVKGARTPGSSARSTGSGVRTNSCKGG